MRKKEAVKKIENLLGIVKKEYRVEIWDDTANCTVFEEVCESVDDGFRLAKEWMKENRHKKDMHSEYWKAVVYDKNDEIVDGMNVDEI